MPIHPARPHVLVRSHTDGDSFEEMGNSMTDARANQERIEAVSCRSVPFLTGEEMFTAWIPDGLGWMTHVIGDVRKALKRSVKRVILARWCAFSRQGDTSRHNPDGTAHLCKLVRGQSSSVLLRFSVLALCQWLPSGRHHGRIHRETNERSAAGAARHARSRVTRPRSMPFCVPPVGRFSSQRPSAHAPWLRKRLRVSLG
jgi:hypothetical protein